MHATREASTPGTCRRPEVLLLLALLSLGSTAAVASSTADPELQALREQLQQMQTAIQQLSEQNRSLREHQQEIERRLKELGAAATPITKEAAVAVAPAG